MSYMGTHHRLLLLKCILLLVSPSLFRSRLSLHSMVVGVLSLSPYIPLLTWPVSKAMISPPSPSYFFTSHGCWPDLHHQEHIACYGAVSNASFEKVVGCPSRQCTLGHILPGRSVICPAGPSAGQDHCCPFFPCSLHGSFWITFLLTSSHPATRVCGVLQWGFTIYYSGLPEATTANSVEETDF